MVLTADAAVGKRELRQRQQVFAGQTLELSGMFDLACGDRAGDRLLYCSITALYRNPPTAS
ncbi:hypothetical protein KCP71_01260 [Salmonella enterica subsp. enterica]|nr:hypothetical protein KCP71_01260 [Salmonella enterica subsp. enterica]